MSRLLHIRRCLCRCFLHKCCCHWDLRHIWFHICPILHDRWMPGWITGLCRPHEWMWNYVEPLHVVVCTLSKHNTNLGHRCKVVREMHPSILNVFEHSLGLAQCGGIVWTYPNCRITLSSRCMTTMRPHRVCPKKHEIRSNSWTVRWPP